MTVRTFKLSLIFVLFVALMMLVPSMIQAANAIADVVPELTIHAQESHKAQTWNATSIQDCFENNNCGDLPKCVPTQYVCEAKDIDVSYCELKPGLSIGLLIGHTVKQVITGFAARTSYWKDRCGA